MKIILGFLLSVISVVAANAQGLTINTQVHNAPGWLRLHSYTYTPGPPTAPFTRVNAGAGWDPGGAVYTSGLAVNNYQLIAPTVGSCTSSASGPGPSGTGSGISDGSCTWKYVGPVDYVTLTGWAYDGGMWWTNGSVWGFRDTVNAGAGDVYQQQTAGCTSTVEPSNTSGSEFFTGDGCEWVYRATLTYTSKANPFPHSRFLHDTFQGYIASGTVTFTGQITSANVITITCPCSGPIIIKMPIFGTNVDVGQYIWGQASGTPNGAGDYYLGGFNSVTTGVTSMTGSYGVVTVTTPPATVPITTSPVLQILSHPSMGTGTGRAAGDSVQGTSIIAGSGTTWYTNSSWTIGSAGSPVTIYLAYGGSTTVFSQAVQAINIYHGQLWNDREYVGGQNGELSPLNSFGHNYEYNDASLAEALPPASDFNFRWGYNYYIEPAPGEGFKDTFNANPSLPLSGYSINNGVGVRGTGVSALQLWDSIVIVQGLQLTADISQVFSLPARSCNGCEFHSNIVEAGTGGSNDNMGENGTFASCGAFCYWLNNLIITRGLTAVNADYGGLFFYNTFYCPTGTCFAAMSNTRDWANWDGSVIHNNAVFGFQHFTSTDHYNNQTLPLDCSWDCTTVQGSNNVTDLSAADGADYPATFTHYANGVILWAFPFATGASFTSSSTGLPVPICGNMGGGSATAGTCGILRNADPNAAFVAYPTNLKPNPSGPLFGAGAFFDTCTLYGFNDGTLPIPNCSTLNTVISGTDLFGNTRPISGRYDTGAVEFGGVGPVISTPGRFFFR